MEFCPEIPSAMIVVSVPKAENWPDTRPDAVVQGECGFPWGDSHSETRGLLLEGPLTCFVTKLNVTEQGKPSDWCR